MYQTLNILYTISKTIRISISKIYNDLSIGLNKYNWIPNIIFSFSIVILIHYLCFFLYKKLINQSQSNKYFVLKALLSATYWPLIVLVWGSFLFFLLKNTPLPLQLKIKFLFIYKFQFQKICFILLCVWFALMFKKKLKFYILQGSINNINEEISSIHAIQKIINILIGLFLVISTLEIFGVPLSGLLTFGGGSVVLVGIIGQQLFSNYLGGLILSFDGHFRVGDWIYATKHNSIIEGIIESIDWRTTTVRMFNKRIIYLPNQIFISEPMVNATKMTHWNMTETLPLRYKDMVVIPTITKEIKEMLFKHKEIDKNLPILACVDKIDTYAINVFVLANLKQMDRIRYREIKHDIIMRLYEIVKNNNASFAYPTQIITKDN